MTVQKHCAGAKARSADFVIRVVAASAVALLLALELGLSAPYWAASTPLIVAFPARSSVIRKGLHRFTGTAVGAGVAAAVMSFSADRLGALLAVAVWLALCAFGSRLLAPSFESYGSVLAGYSCLVIVMHASAGGGSPAEAAMGRALAVWLGLACYLVAVMIPSPVRPQPSPTVTSLVRQPRTSSTVDVVLVGGVEALRAFAVVMLTGVGWVVTNDEYAAILVQVSGIVISLYATRPRTVVIGLKFSAGMVICGALGYLYLVGPISHDLTHGQLVLFLLPVFVAAAVGYQFERFERYIGPFNFLFLQMLRIGDSPPTIGAFTATWIACLLGALVATGAYFVVDSRRAADGLMRRFGCRG